MTNQGPAWRIRLIIWLVVCLAISILLFGELWTKLPQWLSPGGLRSHGVFHWGALCLCILWLWLKRSDILSRMRAGRISLPSALTGIALLALAIFLPRSDYFLVFLMLLSFLGVFTIIFGRACLIPSALLAVYGFSLAFPVLMTEHLAEPSATSTSATVTAVARTLGLPVTDTGLTIQFNSLNGDNISTTIIPACAGYTTLGVFIALFALMMLDIRLPLKRAWYVLLIGLAGTWLLNIIRIEASLAAGYFWGQESLETTHQNISYFIFPLWYALFACIYFHFRQTRKKAEVAGA